MTEHSEATVRKIARFENAWKAKIREAVAHGDVGSLQLYVCASTGHSANLPGVWRPDKPVAAEEVVVGKLLLDKVHMEVSRKGSLVVESMYGMFVQKAEDVVTKEVRRALDMGLFVLFDQVLPWPERQYACNDQAVFATRRLMNTLMDSLSPGWLYRSNDEGTFLGEGEKEEVQAALKKEGMWP